MMTRLSVEDAVVPPAALGRATLCRAKWKGCQRGCQYPTCMSKGLASPQKVLFLAHERYNLSIQWETVQSKKRRGEEGLPE